MVLKPRGRRGAAIALLAVGMATLLVMAALAIDLGRLYLIRGELQNAADAAALAGAIELSAGTADTLDARRTVATRSAIHAGALNKVDCGKELAEQDMQVTVGFMDRDTTPPKVSLTNKPSSGAL